MRNSPPDCDPARRIFAQFRLSMRENRALCEEVTDALRALVTEYSTSIRENRFLVGGAVEHIVGAAMRAVGIPARNRGHLETGADLRIGSAGLSLKACLTPKPGNIGLINTRGSGAMPRWIEPTVLVLAGIGIAYVDPEILPDATKDTNDQVQLVREKYLAFLERHREYVLDVDVPANPKSRATRVASYAVAEEILSRLNFRILNRYRTSQGP